MPAANWAAPAVRSVRETMPTIWGHLEKVDEIIQQEPNLKLMSPKKKEEIQKALREKQST
jgi:hypothetical protein